VRRCLALFDPSERLRYSTIFVGAVAEGLRQREAERARGLEVNQQFESPGLSVAVFLAIRSIDRISRAMCTSKSRSASIVTAFR
jgi:hypothetical protein